MKYAVYMTCGLPGSGKSTWCLRQLNKNKDIVYISPDEEIARLSGDKGYSIEYAREAWSIALFKLENAIKDDVETIIFDSTLIKSKRRKHMISLLVEYDKEGKYFSYLVIAKETNLKKLKKINESRKEHKLDFNIIKDMHSNMKNSRPSREEGWDNIYYTDNFNI